MDGASDAYDKLYSYKIPAELNDNAQCGCRVFVPFGKSNARRIGMIFAVNTTDDDPALKSIISVVDEHPVLGAEMLLLCQQMRESVFCTYFDAVNTILPTGLRYRLSGFYTPNSEFADRSLLEGDEAAVYDYIVENGEAKEEKIKALFPEYRALLLSLTAKGAIIHNVVPKRNAGDFTRKYVRCCTDSFDDSYKATPRQLEVIDATRVAGEVSVKELQYFTGASISVINTLIKNGVLESFEKQEFRMLPRIGAKPQGNDITLNVDQSSAFEGLKEKMFSGSGETALLYGVTGSGKTQVFLKLTDECVKNGRGVIIMVPEIALTPQMINLFSSRYQNRVAIFHSAMSIGQRMDEYRRIELGYAKIAIGTRSAVFAPFDNLGLIVMDEEQEHTYKSEKTPRFHARDIAKFRIKYHKALLCLSSATPSLMSYALADSGKYAFYRLNKRYNDYPLPSVEIVNMRDELKQGNSSDISRRLTELIENGLNEGKQSIILLNRRGHNTYVSCPECGFVATCENCSVSMTYHSANKRLMCHYCGNSVPVYKKCPNCSSEFLSFSGVGTQRIEEELSALFPKARILRLDADSTSTRNSYSVNLGDFAEGKYDIMIGTQMVAKGLDFPKVSLVGVIGADRALSGDDYRGFERTFDLLTQVIGRAGRADGKGIAVIQTSDTDNHVIDLARSQDYPTFYAEEIMNRKIHVFPPFCDLCLVMVQSVKIDAAKTAIREIFSSIKKHIAEDYADQRLIILGPNSAVVPRVAGKYRYKILIKCRNSARFRKMISESTSCIKKPDVSVMVDINPESIL